MRLARLNLSRVLPIGIDIGAGGVRLFQARRTGFSGESIEAVAAARLELPFTADEPGSAARTAQIAASLKARLAAGGFIGRACVLSLDNRLLRVRSVRHPRMPDDELDRAIALDAPARLGFAPSGGTGGAADEKQAACEIGWLRAGEVRQGEEFRDEVILVGAAHDPIERLIFALAGIGLRPQAVEPGFVAAARPFTRALRRTEDQNTVRVIVDVGLLSTGVTIIRGQSIAFHKPLELGGLSMTRAAAQRLGLEPDALISIRRQRQSRLPIEPRVDRAVFEAVRPTLADIANEVSLCLRYFGVSFRGSRPESCLIIGGEAAEPHFDEILSSTTNLPAAVGHPLTGISLDRLQPALPAAGGGAANGPTVTDDAAWTVAAGLSLRGLPTSKRHMGERERAADTAAPRGGRSVA
jgi:type IV pilus assembly protein PilM